MSNEIELKPCPFCGREGVKSFCCGPAIPNCPRCSDLFGCNHCDIWLDTADEWNARTFTARHDEPTDADLEKLGNRAMGFLVAKYGYPQLDRFVNWSARPEQIALEMAEFAYWLQSQPETPVIARRDEELKDARQLETEITELKEIVTAPIDVIIFCPSCHLQHIDEPTPEVCENCGLDVDAHDALECKFLAWPNPPHKSHRCVSCNVVFRLADVPTNGVKNIQTKGENDTWAIHVQSSGD